MEQDLLPILYQDDHFVAINKPSGLLVHPTLIDRHEKRSVITLLQEQLGSKVFVIHRLDKPTSGVLLLALHQEAARKGVDAFAREDVKKVYLAIVRGYSDHSGTVRTNLSPVADKLLVNRQKKEKKAKPAVTRYRTLAQHELPVYISRHPQSRYSLLEVHPQTGRMHQIRRHLKHLHHPIIGDTKHGDHKHNRYFRESLACHRLLLSATELAFFNPYRQTPVRLTATLDAPFLSILDRFGWESAVPTEWLT